MKSEQTTSKPFSAWIKRVIHFLSVDIFRVKENELTSSKRLFIRLLKKLILSIREYINDLLPQRASSLTYYTTLAIIPIFALVLAIGSCFCFHVTLD